MPFPIGVLKSPKPIITTMIIFCRLPCQSAHYDVTNTSTCSYMYVLLEMLSSLVYYTCINVCDACARHQNANQPPRAAAPCLLGPLRFLPFHLLLINRCPVQKINIYSVQNGLYKRACEARRFACVCACLC